jgi:hypothetical protein
MHIAPAQRLAERAPKSVLDIIQHYWRTALSGG